MLGLALIGRRGEPFQNKGSRNQESLAIWQELGHKRALAIRREFSDKRGVATSLLNLGRVAQEQSDREQARGLYAESLAIQRELGDRRGVAGTLNSLGWLAFEHGDYDQALSLYQES